MLTLLLSSVIIRTVFEVIFFFRFSSLMEFIVFDGDHRCFPSYSYRIPVTVFEFFSVSEVYRLFLQKINFRSACYSICVCLLNLRTACYFNFVFI